MNAVEFTFVPVVAVVLSAVVAPAPKSPIVLLSAIGTDILIDGLVLGLAFPTRHWSRPCFSRVS